MKVIIISFLIILTKCMELPLNLNEIKVRDLFESYYSKNKLVIKNINDIFGLTKYEHFKEWYKNYQYIKSFNIKNKNFKLNLIGPFSSINNTLYKSLLRRQKRNLGYKQKLLNNKKYYNITKGNENCLPTLIDYRCKYKGVRNQGHCASCYAFATVGAIEGRINLNYNILVDLSEQQVVSCSQNYGNIGCSDGLSYNSFQYIVENNLTLEKFFPYKAEDSTCMDIPKYIKLTNYFNVKGHMKEAIARGPIDIAMDASNPTFQLYSNGYYDEKNCYQDPDLLNHEMVAVGYGYNNGKLYYIIRNSWGESWGIDGYAYVYDNICGISSDPVEPYDPEIIS